MYTKYYGLNKRPFESNVDHSLLYLGDTHKEALALLVYAVRQKRSLVVLTGESGMGKTTLIDVLLKIEKKAKSSLIVNPCVDQLDFYRLIFHDLGIDQKCSTKADFLIAFNVFLIDHYRSSSPVVLIVDEAQELSTDILREIRFILNSAARYPDTFVVILSGQPKLKERIEEDSLKNLRQRISAHFRLKPFNEEETRNYTLSRLSKAGCPEHRQLINEEAFPEISRISGGIPRLINSICDSAFLLGYLKKSPVIDRSIVLEAAKEIEFFERPETPPRQPAIEITQANAATPNPGWFRRLFH